MPRCRRSCVGVSPPTGESPRWPACPDAGVVNTQGRISERGSGDSVTEQRMLREDETVVFDRRGRIDLIRFGIDT